MAWSYSGTNGPEYWSKIYPTAAGSRQSPINIQTDILNNSRLDAKHKLKWTYQSDYYTLTNSGHSWHVHIENNKSVVSGGPLTGEYELESIHTHWGSNNSNGSEHSIDGKKYAAELHLVHWNKTKYRSFQEATNYPDGLCVIGIFLEVGSFHSELQKIVEKIPEIVHKGDTVKLSKEFNPNLLYPKKHSYWTYLGSLTTPPCNECVTWIVFSEPVQISNEQLEISRVLRSHTFENCNFNDNESCSDQILQNYRPTITDGERVVLFSDS